MAYEILDESKIVPYLLNIPVLRNFFGTDRLEVREIGDGNLNYVYIVHAMEKPEKALIVKQAVPYLRIAGEGYPLSRERMSYEIRALQIYNDLIPKHVPEVLYADEAMSVVVMQYLSDHIIMREGMIEAVVYPDFAAHMGEFLARTLFRTSSLCLESAAKRQMAEMFIGNTELCALTETFVFTAPYMEHETNEIDPLIEKEAAALREDSDFKVAMLELKYLFMNRSDALLHGDLHTGSIMINTEETCVIDPEFAFFGPFGFDIGALVGNLVMSWVSHFERSKESAYQAWILKSIEELYGNFETGFLGLWDRTTQSALVEKGFIDKEGLKRYQAAFMQNILQESIGFAGAKICRRQLGIAGVADIRGIEEPESRARAEKMALAIGIYLVKNHKKMKSIGDLTDYLKEVKVQK
ncbi:MAG: S-methyl-5-thioribose kinase [Helicobacteraceae bacterium 4484_230]|nr:MAG: S-methyl-5-thioribose kinase [Helicobacteraceae bacterium 4484_230]